MELFDEYKLSHRKAIKHYRITRGLGLIPIVLTLFLMMAQERFPGPGLWFSLGFSVSLQMILRSGYDIHRTKRHGFQTTQRLVQTSDAWFPFFMAGLQWAFISLTILLIWFTVCDLGFPHFPMQHGLIILLLSIWPLRRFLQIKLETTYTFHRDVAIDFLHYLSIFATTVLIVSSLTLFFISPDKPLTTNVPGPVIILWTPAVLVGFGCLIVFIDRFRRKKNHSLVQ